MEREKMGKKMCWGVPSGYIEGGVREEDWIGWGSRWVSS